MMIKYHVNIYFLYLLFSVILLFASYAIGLFRFSIY
jgi:hypothetical protein